MSVGPDTTDRVARYLDGLLSGGELARFERALETDADLRRELEMQERVDRSLRRVMPYTAREIRFDGAGATPAPQLRLVPGEAPRAESRARSDPAGLPWRRLRWYAAAAAVLLVAAVTVNILTREHVPLIPPERVYARLVEGGFKPEFVCTTDEAFAKAVRDQLGQALVARAAGSVALLGWAYGNQYEGRLIGFRTLVLMTRVEGEPVVVLMDRVGEDRSLGVSAGSGLRIFRRRIGDLVCYEVTPREKPAVLDLLYDPDRPGG
jgi:hypothetical protein